MLDIGMQELLVVMVIALLVFGPYKLPELGRAVGRAMREFRRASDEFRSTIETNLRVNDESLLSTPASIAPPTEADASVEDPSPSAADPEGTGDLGDAAEPLDALAASDSVAGGAGSLAGAETLGGSGFEGTMALPLGSVEPFRAQRHGRLLHRSGCGWAARIAESERVVFKTVGEARESGLQPCPVCAPEDEELHL